MSAPLSTLRYGATAAGAISLGLSAFPHLFERYSNIFRMLLNGSWGFLVGSHIWACIVSGNLTKRVLPPSEHEKIHSLNLSIFFPLSTLGGSLLLLSTSCLVPNNMLLRAGSAATVIASLVNSAFILPKQISLRNDIAIMEKNGDLPIDTETTQKDGKPLTLTALKKTLAPLSLASNGLIWVSFAGLLPYIAS